MSIRFFYFDLGNVLVSFCHDRMIRQMASVAGTTPEKMQQLVMGESAPRTSLHWQMERGDLSPAEAHGVLQAALGEAGSPDDMQQASADIFEPMAPSLQLVRSLHQAGHRLGVLSNTNQAHWNWLTSGWIPELNECFQILLTSFEARCVKPDPEIYHLAAQQADAVPDEVFFVDDRADNVAGALAAGLDAVPFTSVEQLERDLRVRGVEW